VASKHWVGVCRGHFEKKDPKSNTVQVYETPYYGTSSSLPLLHPSSAQMMMMMMMMMM
jgi:hypothetical protein